MDKKNINDLLDNFKFVVPEIQREYVWGTPKNKRVLMQFLRDLDYKLKQGNANIGFLYSYKSGTEHYLIDGQQRYTTILLLCYYLAVSEGQGCHKQFISRLNFDSNVPAFTYRVRSNTESFLQNLFKSGVIYHKSIYDQTWFKSEYENDPTISSMIGALEVFGNIIDECENLSLSNVVCHVFFWYFDVDMTSQGEELYITMNSRGEKLTDSEQIKPRLLKRANNEKEFFGKEWDNWEEFFYNKDRRRTRGIGSIDTAMNNIIRIVLELKTCHEHNRINPVEDAEAISIQDVSEYMNALIAISKFDDGSYQPEIVRLYGDSSEDGEFYVLKALLTEYLKGQDNMYEYVRVYQTIRNHVRRNKLNNRPFLTFLNKYRDSSLSWYDYILMQEEQTKVVFNGHELEKIRICKELGNKAESEIWKVQAHPFWNGEIKLLVSWSKNSDVFSLQGLTNIYKSFLLLFDKKEDEGWTSDNVRQALIPSLTSYPLDECFFGYSSDQWKQIMNNNTEDFQNFLNRFSGMDKESRDLFIKEINLETPENKWAEFVHHDYLLEYCNTKRIQYREEYGIECVKNSYKQPFSVKNMHLDDYLSHHLKDHLPEAKGWIYWVDRSAWKSVIKFYKDQCVIQVWIQYRKDKKEQYEIALVTSDYSFSDAERTRIESMGFILKDNVYYTYVSENMDKLMKIIKQCFTINTTNESED
jgi:hypothetical protein